MIQNNQPFQSGITKISYHFAWLFVCLKSGFGIGEKVEGELTRGCAFLWAVGSPDSQPKNIIGKRLRFSQNNYTVYG